MLLEGDGYRPIHGDVNVYWLIDGRLTNVTVGEGSVISLIPPVSRVAKSKAFQIGRASCRERV